MDRTMVRTMAIRWRIGFRNIRSFSLNEKGITANASPVTSYFSLECAAMAERFIVEGGRRLEGTIRPGGNKNAALPILAACLLTDEPVVLRNLPDIQDVRVMLQIMEGLGTTVERLEPNVFRLHTKGECSSTP